jgi:dTDP-4-dehydrorhamnose 3,5-epimerase
VIVEPLGVADAWVVTMPVYGDDRGYFLEWFRFDTLEAAAGRRFEVKQANHSSSARGVVRGIHYADVPPGQAKFVYCPVGQVLDVVVDLRLGSPTFGMSHTVLLSAENRQALFIAEGLGHGFCALEPDSSVVYLLSSPYNPSSERSIHVLDADLAVQWPVDAAEMLLSDKDRDAPSLAEAEAKGLLPDYSSCRAVYEQNS